MPDENSKNVFVTGATTPIGRETVRQLVRAGYSVVGAAQGSAGAALVRADGGMPAYPDPARAGELRSAIRAADARIVVHLETTRHNTVPFNRPTWDANAVRAAGAAIVEAAKAADAAHLIFGSALLAGVDTDGEHPPSAEIAAIVEALRAAESAALESGLPTLVLRFGYAYGADSDDLRAAAAAIQTGRPINVGALPAAHGRHNGNDEAHAHHGARAGFIHTADAASAILKAIEGAVSGQTLDICGAEFVAPAEFARRFAAAQGMSLMSIPPLIGRGLAAIGAAARLQHGLLALAIPGDPAPAQSALNWTPRFPQLQPGIDDLLLSWRAAAVGA
jgi:nucleoside-diphosphate-sugar epimerase